MSRGGETGKQANREGADIKGGVNRDRLNLLGGSFLSVGGCANMGE